MYCPTCHRSHRTEAKKCTQCGADIVYIADRLYIGRQFIFVDADEEHPIALRVDDAVQTYQGRAVLSRHAHAIGFGDKDAWDLETAREKYYAWAMETLPDLPVLPLPELDLTAVVTDRKIYKPGDDATLFIVASDAGQQVVTLEVQLAGQKVYEAKLLLNADGLALHRYADVREGEYTAVVTFADRPAATAQCTFSVAEFTLSPLIATLEDYQVVKRLLTVRLKILLLSQPYSGPAELRLHCPVCAQQPSRSGLERLEEFARPSAYISYGRRISRPIAVEVRDGAATGEFRLCDHDGPFHIEVVTPQGHTAQVALPNLGATEREKICINPLGQTVEASLAPWPGAQPVRGLYLGPGEVAMTPFGLESAYTDQGTLRAWTDVPMGQLVTFNPHSGERKVTEIHGLDRDAVLTFDVGSPYTLFTVAVFLDGAPFEGWGVVIKPVAFNATLIAPATAAPGAEIEVYVEPRPNPKTGHVPGLFCWLLAYDARLEHESPLPKLGKRIYEGIKGAEGTMKAHKALKASLKASRSGWELWQDLAVVDERMGYRGPTRFMVRSMGPVLDVARGLPVMAKAARAVMEVAVAEPEVEAVEMVVTPARMEFPELVYNELFYLEGTAARTIKLGDQIGTWRVRAYLFRGADCRELTADIQAEKLIYAELDLPAIASDGDEIIASAQYHTAEPAELFIATPYGEMQTTVQGHGSQCFAVKGPGRVEVRLAGEAGSDWTVRDIAAPGIQRVTASRLMILRRGETARGERVAVYAAVAPVLADTIAALLAYPFG